MIATDAAELVGRTLGEFVVREPLSSGGFGLVFRAEQPALGREAVIKVLQTRHRATETVVQRFLREAKLASKLDHPYAAHTYAFGAEPDGILWIAMELVRGTPLDKLLAAQGPIPLARFVPLLDGICEVVHTAHEQGIVHRDLKPANVMVLSRAGRLLPKLLDFGIAKLSTGDAAAPRTDPALDETADDATPPPVDGRLTQDGATIGSPLYMAPEQWMDAGTVDARTDLYALGVLAYEALTGTPPFTGHSKLAIAMAHARQQPPPLGPDFPAALDGVLAKVLAKASRDRHASALEFAAAFRAASGVTSEPITLPRLDEAVRIAALGALPQPLAQAVAALDAARHAHQARDALWQVARVAVRLCGVIALAAHAHVRAGASSDDEAGLALRRLRRGALTDAEWLALARELVRPFVAVKDAHPVPELVALLAGDATPLDELLTLRAGADVGGGEERVRELYARALPALERALGALSFLSAYRIVVDGERGAEAWMGARRDREPVRVHGRPLAPREPALVDAGGVPVLSLHPFAQVCAPSPGAPDALFLFDGKGRRGARLVALPDPFEHEDEHLWDALGAVLRDDDAADERATVDERGPFPGLAAFTAGDAARFVGRERETEAFVNRLRVTPLLAVVGPSGAGKSSFVQAGVIPALPAGWRALTVRPGPAPAVSLAAKLASVGVTIDPREPASLGDALRAHARAHGQTIVLVVDQLEELFTLCEDATAREGYARALGQAARAADDPVRVIVTLRDDFLIDAEGLPALRSRLGAALQLLTTPAEADLVRILTAPVRAAGYDFDDAALPGEMVASIARAPGALALLSFTAQKLWELRDRRFRQLTRKAYGALGGVGGALAQHAEATLTAMHPEAQRLVREVFRHAVTADGTRAVMSRAELDQVLGGGPHADRVVEALIAARLLVASEDGGGERPERIEVTHEALLDAWPRLVAWRREDAEGARLRDQLRAAARQWDERGRPSGLLWRGDALAEYRLWRARTPGALTDAEQAFAAASLADDARGRRRRTLAIGGAFVVLAAGVIALLIMNAAARRERARAEASQADAEASAQRLHDRLQAQYESQGRRLVVGGDPLQGLAYLAKAAELGAHGRAHDFLVAEAIAATDGELTEVHHDNAIRSASFSTDGARLVTASYDKTARIWDARTGAPLHALAHGDIVMRASFSPDGARVLTASLDGTAAVWDVATGARLHVLAHEGPVMCAAFAPDGAAIVTASRDDHVILWNAATGAPRATWTGDGAGQVACAFTPDGARVVVGDHAGTIRVWALAGGAPIVLRGGHGRVGRLQVSPDGARLLATGADGTASIWDVAAGREVAILRHKATVITAAWSPDGARVATASLDHTAAIWDAATGARRLDLAGHAAGVNSIAFAPDGARVVTTSDDGTARLWDAATGAPLARWLGHRGQVIEVAFAGDGRRVVTCGDDGAAIVWDAAPQGRVVRLTGHASVVLAAAFAPDGAHVVTAGLDGTARVFDATTGRELLLLRGHRGRVEWAAYAPDGRTIATAGEDGTIRLWDAATGAAMRVLAGHDGAVLQVAWSPDGATLASAGDDGSVRAWAVATGEPRFTIAKAHGGFGVHSITYTPDGTHLVTTGDDNHTRWWDASTGAAGADHADHDTPGSVSFDPAGRRGASPINQRLRLWDAGTGATLLDLVGHVGEVTATVAAWSPDGALVVTGSLDGTARIWDPQTGEPLAIFVDSTQVYSAGFSPEGARILTSSDDGTATIRELPRYGGSDADLARLLRCRVPFAVDADRVVARPVDRAACAPSAP